MDDADKNIIDRKCGFVEQQVMTPEQAVINQKLYALDLVAHRMELKWGVGRLYELSGLDVKARWDLQREKLVSAIIAKDMNAVDDLIAGSIRGLAYMEQLALKAGHVPFEPMIWEVKVDALVIPVVRTLEDQIALPKDTMGRDTVTLEQLVRCYVARHEAAFPGALKGEYKPTGKPMDEELSF